LYGDGQIVRECAKRGWICLATRSPGFVQSPAVKMIVEQLATMIPIDRQNVFILGHSMGAAQTIDVVQRDAGYYAGAAVMGGGGRIREAKVFDSLPLFIGVGTNDFARAGAKSLNQTLIKAQAKHLTFKEYSEVEHLVIVREALPDVFAMFDEIAKRK
jgi:predicted peptidase